MESLSVPGQLESLKEVADYVLAAAAGAGLDYPAAYRLRLAVDEIVTNIILHGFSQQEGRGTLIMWTEVNADYLTIVLEDDGCNYNPYEALPPDSLHGPAEERQVGGLGIYLALRGVDQFHYRRLGNRNRSTFRVWRRAGQPS